MIRHLRLKKGRIEIPDIITRHWAGKGITKVRLIKYPDHIELKPFLLFHVRMAGNSEEIISLDYPLAVKPPPYDRNNTHLVPLYYLAFEPSQDIVYIRPEIKRCIVCGNIQSLYKIRNDMYICKKCITCTIDHMRQSHETTPAAMYTEIEAEASMMTPKDMFWLIHAADQTNGGLTWK